MKTLNDEWVIEMRVTAKNKDVIFKSKLECISEAIIPSIMRMKDEAQSAMDSYKNLNPKYENKKD